jgi:hypothetical protein
MLARNANKHSTKGGDSRLKYIFLNYDTYDCFLDAERIHNLTSYLRALNERGLANGDHTTLLLNCYTKLKVILCLQ